MQQQHKGRNGAALNETKRNLQGTNSEGKEAGIQIKIWNIRKKYTFNQNRNKKQEFKKYEDSIRRLWEISECANIRIIGMPEGEEEEQEIENLFEKTVKENFPNLAKEIHILV